MISYVYGLKCEGFIKVGFTSNLKNRIKNISDYNPFWCDLIFSYEYKNRAYAKKIESLIHLELKDSNIKGEWFHFNDETLSAIQNVVQKYPNYFLDKKYQDCESLYLIRESISKKVGFNAFSLSNYLKDMDMPIASKFVLTSKYHGYENSCLPLAFIEEGAVDTAFKWFENKEN